MESLLNLFFSKYEFFLLVFVRMTGIFIIAPIFSRKNVPTITKIVFSLLISVITVNTIKTPVLVIGGYEIIVLVIREILIGLIIGFVSYLFFTALYVAGQIVDMQIGFGMVNVLDPQHNVQIPITGNYYYILAILLFLVIDGHHMLIKGIMSSYEILPVGEIVINENVTQLLINIIGEIFIIGFKVSAPILATIFIVNILLGILARTIPQMNVFMVGMPLKIIVGLITLIVTIPIFILALQHIFNNMYEEIFNFIKVLQEG